MSRGRFGGLSGKARLRHNRFRARRSEEDRQINEFLHRDAPRRDRLIPIRARGEFLPSAAFVRFDEEGAKSGQLRLPLQQDDTPVRAKVGRGLTIGERKWGGDRSAHSARGAAPARPDQHRKSADAAFSAARFSIGCAVGSAVAAALLLVIGLVFG